MKLADLKRFRARHAGLIAVGLVATVVFFVVGAGLRLWMGPVSLSPFSDRLSQAISQALPGIAVKFDSASLGWSPSDGRVDLIVLGARVYDSRGRIIAQAPRADLVLGSTALVSGKLEVQRITLVGVQLTLVRTREGGVRLGVSNDKDQPDLLKKIKAAIDASSGAATTLQSFAVKNARLAFYDETSGLFIVSPNAAMQVSSARDSLAASVDADIEVSGRKAHIAANISLPPGNAPTTGHFALTDLNLAAVGRNAKAFSALDIVEVNVNLAADVVFAGNRLSTVKFQSTGQGGIDGWGPKGGRLALGNLSVSGAYDANTGRVQIDNASAADGQVNLHLTGNGQLSYDANDTLTGAALDAAIDRVAVDMPGIFPGVMKLSDVKVAGNYIPATGEANLTRLDIRGRNLSINLTGKTTFGESSPAIDLSGRINAISVREVLGYWPTALGSGAREWIDENISAGRVGPVTIAVQIPSGALDAPALPESALNIAFPFTNITGTYVHGLTPANSVNGKGLMTGNTFTAQIDSGKIGNIAITQGKGLISNVAAEVPVGKFSVHAQGQMPEILTLIDMKPLNYPTRFGIDPQSSGGTASVDVTTDVPMLRNLAVDDIAVHVGGTIADFAITLGKNTQITKGDITFVVDNAHLEASGAAHYAGQPVTLDWTEDFRTNDPITTRINARGTFDTAGRAAIGLDLGDLVTGPATIKTAITGNRGQLHHAQVAADLTKARLFYGLVNFDKPAGTPAHADVLVTFGPGARVESADLKVAAKGMAVQGVARFAEDASLATLDLPVVKSGANDFALVVQHGAGRAIDIAVKGKALDGSALTKRDGAPAKDGGKSAEPARTPEQKFDGPFKLSVNVEHLALRDGILLDNFALEGAGDEDRIKALSLSAVPLGTGKLSARLEHVGANRKLAFSSTNGGALVQGIFGLDSLKGGKIVATLNFPGNGDAPVATGPDFEGIVVAEDFRILHQPFLARLFAAGSLTGFADLMSSKGIAVDKLTIPFKSTKGVINIRQAHASGPAIGFSADGYVDRPDNKVGLRGTIAPLYGINSVLGAIPLLGSVLTSREGEGILGTTYAVSGNADEPEINVNPLSMLTPGILRRIFEGKIPTAKPAPITDAPTPTPKPETP